MVGKRAYVTVEGVRSLELDSYYSQTDQILILFP
jgi:hypothetical protein